jgi:hypothetical protein
MFIAHLRTCNLPVDRERHVWIALNSLSIANATEEAANICVALNRDDRVEDSWVYSVAAAIQAGGGPLTTVDLLIELGRV